MARLFGSDRFRSGAPFVAAALSPDATLVASVHGGGLVCLWDAGTGKRLASAQGPLLPTDIAFMPDGKRLVSCAFGTIEYRDLPDLTVARTDHVVGRLQRLAVSSDGRWVASGGMDIRLWDATADTPPRVLGTNGLSTGSLAFFADGKSLLSTGLDSVARIWDIETGKQRLAINVGLGVPALTASVSRDGKTIATAAGNSVRFWDAETGVRLPSPHFNGGGSSGTSVAFSPAGDLLAVARGAGFVTLWDCAARKDLFNFHTLPGANAVHFSSDGKVLCIQGPGLELWDTKSGRPLSAAEGHRGPVTAVAASPDGHWVVTGDTLGQFWFWDTATGVGRPANLKPQFNGYPGIAALRFSQDGQTLWLRVHSALEALPLVNTRTSRRFTTNDATNPEISLSNDEQTVALCEDVAGGRDVVLVNAVAMQKLRRLSTQNRMPSSLVFRPGGGELAGSLQGHAQSWDSDSGRVLREYPSDNDQIQRLCYSPDGRYLAGTGRSNVLLWNADAGDIARKLELAEDAPAHQAQDGPVPQSREDPVRHEGPADAVSAAPVVHPAPGAIAFSPDGELLAVVAGRASIDIFEVLTGQWVARFSGHEGGTNAIAFLPDGQRLASGGANGTAAVWDLAGVLPPPDAETLRFPRLLMDDLWKRLDSESAAEGYAAVAALAARPADALHLMAERLPDPDSRTPRRLARAISLVDAIGTEAAAKAQQALVLPDPPAQAATIEQKRAEAAFKSAAGELQRRAARTDPPTPEPVLKAPQSDTADMAYADAKLVHPLRPTTRPAPNAAATTRPAAPKKARVPDPATVAPPAVPDDQVLTENIAVRRLAIEGDPSVLATLDKWLHDGADAPEIGMGSTEFRTAMEYLTMYRVEAEVPVMVSLYNNPTADVTVREWAAVAVARVGTPRVRDFLIDVLSGQVLGYRGRLLVAAALVRLDSDEGRDALLEEYQEYLDDLDGGFVGNEAVRQVVATLYDVKLVDRLGKMLDQQTTESAAKNVRAMIEQMQTNALPMDRLRETAEDTNWDHAGARITAIVAIANQGGADMVPFLRALKPWAAGSKGDNPQQRQMFDNIRTGAIADIRRNHWMEISR